MITLNTKDYYNRPEYYRFMPPEIFNALEYAELKEAWTGNEITVEVEKALFDKMIEDFNNSKSIDNGSENN